MNILIDIGHPAHVHLFKNFAWIMIEKGHAILFTCREKEFEIELLKKYGFFYKSFGKKYASRVGKLWGLVEFDIRELLAGLKFKPDILLSHGSIYAAHAAWLLRKPHISFEDTFNFEQINVYLPFTKCVLTGNYSHPTIGKKEISYAGYHELAYLHPNRYSPDREIFKFLKIKKDEKYAIMRFIAWTATHDYGHKGISTVNKIKAVHKFEKYGRLFISSENELPFELKSYKINIPPDKMHDALFYSQLLLSESATMASECSMFGVPAVYIDNTSRYYTKDQEQRYDLCFNYTESESDQLAAIDKCVELLQSDNRVEWQKRRDRMIADKIDVSAFIVWFIENYPDSVRIMKEDPEYQYRFR